MAIVLRVNLSTGSVRTEAVPADVVERYVGGRGVGTKLLLDHGDPTVDAYDPRNPLIFATGPVTGTFAPTGGRYMVVTKSPLTGAVACSNSGGYWGPALRYAGYDYLMIEGAAKEPVYLCVLDDRVEIRPAKHVWGKMVAETEDIIRGETHPDAKIAGIGPAGEHRSRTACVMNDRGRAAGRSGVGGVMGAKNLKAIACWGTKGVRVADAAGFVPAARSAVKAVASSPVADGLTMLGTAGTVDYMNAVGMLPVRNFLAGTYPGAAKVNGIRVKEDFMTRNRGCHSCVINCGRVTKVTGHGSYDGHGEGPEYETIFGLGTSCGLDDLAAIIKANYLCNEYGMDTIEAGCAVATAMELFERGYLPEKDVGFPLRFGDHAAMIRAIEAMGRGEGFGLLLADGGYRVAEKYGHPELFIGSKKQAFAAYDPRGAIGMGLAYATSNRGACHLRGYMVSLEHFGNPVKLDPFTTDEKAQWLCLLQNQTAFTDASGICLFSTMAMPPEMLADMVGTALGMKLTPEQAVATGERIWNLERVFNLKAGLSKKDDALPPRMLKEPLGEGMSAGHVVPLEPMLADYYRLRGWDPAGRPTPDTLATLRV
ncbi:MAG TPA: aldehyde ferredoxin oxidoreductase family protein [Candidatus Binatus sp.]|nr:aldehyde ferredoxin oxidoreductase family protein [Candidatus Binatus sp.]